MSRLNARDGDRAKELAAALRMSVRAQPTSELLDGLRELIDADRLLVYGIKPGPSGYRLDVAHWSGFRTAAQQLNSTLARGLARAKGPWALFDPLEPAPQQRDVAVMLPAPTRYGDSRVAATLVRLGYTASDLGALAERMRFLNARALPHLELADLGVCRSLLCEGARLLAFVGAFRAGSFSERERLIMKHVIAPLRARLRRERMERRAPLQAAAITALLEALDAPALIVDAEGAIEETNARGHALLRADAALRAEIREALRGNASGRLTLTPLPGVSAWLVSVTDRETSRKAGLRTVAERFALTPQELSVLQHLVDGLPTKAMAEALGCTTRTVEFHLTRLYRKTATDGRTALVARVFANV
jgi:DNA-binding CsgD family transcriptional regulator